MSSSSSAAAAPGALTRAFVAACWEPLAGDAAFRASRNAVATTDVLTVVQNRDVLARGDRHVYSNRCSKEGRCTSQKSSGRCWMFAMCNVMRVAMMKRFKLPDDFELSQGYLFFYDKLERGNYFLTSVIKTVDLPVDSRLVSHLASDPLCDGGQWDMLVNIVEKWGVCPKTAFPETKCCVASRRMNQFLVNKLRTWACELRAFAAAPGAPQGSALLDALYAKKTEYMRTFHKILATFFGAPPTTFDWRFRDKDKTFHCFTGLTPQSFYARMVPFDISSHVSLIHDPRNEYYKLYTVAFLGNVVGGHGIRYINVPIDELRAAAVKTIDGDQPVWFGCDVGKSLQRADGLLDLDVYDFESAFGTGFGMDKRERLLYGESLMTHAMVFTAYDRAQAEGVNDTVPADPADSAEPAEPAAAGGEAKEADTKTQKKKAPKPERNAPVGGAGALRAWRVENSWGTDKGDKGYLHMTDAWFGEWVCKCCSLWMLWLSAPSVVPSLRCPVFLIPHATHPPTHPPTHSTYAQTKWPWTRRFSPTRSWRCWTRSPSSSRPGTPWARWRWSVRWSSDRRSGRDPICALALIRPCGHERTGHRAAPPPSRYVFFFLARKRPTKTNLNRWPKTSFCCRPVPGTVLPFTLWVYIRIYCTI